MVATDGTPPRRLVVLGDSLTFHGPDRVYPYAEPRLFPQIAARALADLTEAPWRADVAAGLGWTAREAWWAVTKDPRVWGDLLPSADAVVLAVGSMDALPASVPTVLRESIRYVRPGWARRGVRQLYRAASPRVIRATGGAMRQLPQTATDHYLSRIVSGIRYFRPDVPVVALGPAPHAAPAYPSGAPYPRARRASQQWALQMGVGWLDVADLVEPELPPEGRSNPDGMHWGWEVHAEVGRRLAECVVAASVASGAAARSGADGQQASR